MFWGRKKKVTETYEEEEKIQCIGDADEQQSPWCLARIIV